MNQPPTESTALVAVVVSPATLIGVDRLITAEVAASPQATLRALADLSTYPEWLPVVSSAIPDETTDDVWMVTLRARLGPLARSKRLRMVRVALDDHTVRFERSEVDGREHAAWILEAAVVEADNAGCRAEVSLHYSGTLWSAPLEGALLAVEGTAAKRLGEYLTNG